MVRSHDTVSVLSDRAFDGTAVYRVTDIAV